MGRFATTVAHYEALRPPYPAELFRAVAQNLSFGKAHALIESGRAKGKVVLEGF